jgi:hypothetical protein
MRAAYDVRRKRVVADAALCMPKGMHALNESEIRLMNHEGTKQMPYVAEITYTSSTEAAKPIKYFSKPIQVFFVSL